ncbi:sulfur carrier protein ThiS [Thermodesulfobacteriota bacterium]
MNNHNYEWEEGITVETLLQTLKNDSRFADIINEFAIVAIDTEIILRDEFAYRRVNDGDDILVFPPMGGG